MGWQVFNHGGYQMYLIAKHDVTRDDIATLCDEVEKTFNVSCEPLLRTEGGLHITDWPGKVAGQDRDVRLPQFPYYEGTDPVMTEDKEVARGSDVVCYREGRIDIVCKHYGMPGYTRREMELWAACFERIDIELKCWKSYWNSNQREFPRGF